MRDKLYSSIITRVLAFDALLMILTVGAWVFASEIHDFPTIVGLWLLVHLVRGGLWLADLHMILAPVRRWRDDPEGTRDADLLAADVALSRLPMRVSIHYSVGWGLTYMVIPLLSWFGLTGVITTGRNELIAALPTVLGAIVALPALALPLLQQHIESSRLELGAQLERRGLARGAAASSVIQRMAIIAVGLALGPLHILLSVAWTGESQTKRATALEAGKHAVYLALAESAHGRDPGDGVEVFARDALPAVLVEALAASPSVEVVEVVDHRRERVFVAGQLDDGRFVVATRSSSLDLAYALPLIAITALLVIVWAIVAIAALGRTIMTPLERLRDASKRIVEIGDLREMGQIPAAEADEIGELTHNFNVMTKTFEQLADAAAKVANGDLSIEIMSQGDLPDAFAAMVDQLHDVVARIRSTAVDLATAASEIQAATQEQEAASERQDAAMVALGDIMRELTESSTQVSGAAAHVLDNAEGTLRTTDETTSEITNLRQDIQGIEELLDLINEIADRSDLLALNGSLEATRAGEAGRGFALVAAEMRRLAERVTGTVADVRQQVANIQRSSASTVTATTRSHGLAEETAKAAREIVTESDRQQASTDQASHSVRDVGQVIAQVQGATTQTRSTAEGLRDQALVLERLIDAFILRED